ncbi:hypothetical protein [uncultured Bacteroides sp.]|nr:hypothetical protein [uncultured Bacteroides sp.]
MKESTNLAESTPAKDVRIKEGNRQPVLLAQQVITVLNTRYDFRYNLLTEELSFAPTVAATSLFDI